MRDLDKEVADAIKHLEGLSNKYQQEIFNMAQIIRGLYPENFVLALAIECAEEQRTNNNIHISMHRKTFNDIKNFKEKKSYYENTLAFRELGFRHASMELNNFLKKPRIRPYEEWVNENTINEIEKKGVKRVILDELLFGNLI